MGALTDQFVIGLWGRYCCDAIYCYNYPVMLQLLYSFIRICQIMFLVYIFYPVMSHLHAIRIFSTFYFVVLFDVCLSMKLLLIFRHENPQIEISNAHDNSVWDLAWHPIGYLLSR